MSGLLCCVAVAVVSVVVAIAVVVEVSVGVVWLWLFCNAVRVVVDVVNIMLFPAFFHSLESLVFYRFIVDINNDLLDSLDYSREFLVYLAAYRIGDSAGLTF